MADFQEKISQFTDNDVQVVAASSETAEEAANTIEKLGLTYPVAYGLVPKEFAGRFGAFYSDDATYLHATGFLIDPEGAVDISAYSCGAIGRFTADDALQILSYRLKPEE